MGGIDCASSNYKSHRRAYTQSWTNICIAALGSIYFLTRPPPKLWICTLTRGYLWLNCGRSGGGGVQNAICSCVVSISVATACLRWHRSLTREEVNNYTPVKNWRFSVASRGKKNKTDITATLSLLEQINSQVLKTESKQLVQIKFHLAN